MFRSSLTALTFALLFAACGGKAASPTTTTTLPGEGSGAAAPATPTEAPAADATAPGTGRGATLSDAEVAALVEQSIVMTEQMLAAATAASGDCKVMAGKLKVVFDDNAALLARGAELKDEPDLDARMEKALSGDLGTRAGKAQESLGAVLQPCGNDEDIAKLFERLY